MNRLFLCPFFFFFLRNTESSVKFEDSSNREAGNPFIASGGKHKGSSQDQRQCSEYLLNA